METSPAAGSPPDNYDSISLRDSNNVWIDRNTFEDQATADSKATDVLVRPAPR